jgi:hypothetical protein
MRAPEQRGIDPRILAGLGIAGLGGLGYLGWRHGRKKREEEEREAAQRAAASSALPNDNGELKPEHIEARQMLAEKIAQAGLSPKQLEDALIAQMEKSANPKVLGPGAGATAGTALGGMEAVKKIVGGLGTGLKATALGLPPAAGLYLGWLSERPVESEDIQSIRDKSLLEDYSRAIDTLREQQGYMLEGTRAHEEDEERRQARRRKNLLRGLAIGLPTAAAGYAGYRALAGDKPTA